MRRCHCAVSPIVLLALLLLSCVACDAVRFKQRLQRHSPTTTSSSDGHSSSADEDAIPTAVPNVVRELLYNGTMLAACPAVRTLTRDCHDENFGWYACVAGGAMNETASVVTSGGSAAKKNAVADECANALYVEAWVPDSGGQVGAVNASGLRIAAVKSLDINWKTVDLSNNWLTAFDLSSHEPLNGSSMNLADNRLTSLASVVPTAYLTSLNVSRNPLGTMMANDNHSSLETLVASNASLTAINVTAASNLQGLLVPHNNLSSFESIALLNSLSTLDLSFNQLRNWSSVILPRRLSVLMASDNNITTLPPMNLTTLDQLAAIDFSFNQIETIGGILWHPSLTELDLRENPISRFEIRRSDLTILSKKDMILRIAPFISENCAERGGVLESVGIGGNVHICVIEVDFNM
uniref:Leucine-rich repeat-containing N-terminal plant-type domain-containing protein n=1 Tax=Globisporangium ultimum (strain ATCC 200006 / CBS 805.95 / DAOM BR144) TaxID=431595 RepID=K3X7V8_GLOUD